MRMKALRYSEYIQWWYATESGEQVAHLCSLEQKDDFWNGLEPRGIRQIPQAKTMVKTSTTMQEGWKSWKRSRNQCSWEQTPDIPVQR